MTRFIRTMLLIIVLAATACSASANETQRLVNDLGIMQGDDAGDFNEDGLLTREQLAKITVNIVEPEFIPVSSVSPFYDVPYHSWASGYIRRSNELGIFTGFPNGSFMPHGLVMPEQICKVMLQLLGYQNESAAVNWADAQISAAQSKGLLNGVAYKPGVPITRLNAAAIIKNALLTRKKDSDIRLVSDGGYIFLEDAVLITDKNVSKGYVLTSAGSFKRGNVTPEDISKKGSLIINKYNEITAFIPTKLRRDSHIIKTVISDNIIVFGKSGDISIKCDGDVTVYDGAVTSDFRRTAGTLEMGDKITVCYGNNNETEYIIIARNEMEGPFTNLNGSFIKQFNITEQSIISRDAKTAQISSIADYDICYYVSQADTALIYSTKVAGIYQEALPNKENPQSVIISGKQYEIDSVNAFAKLSFGGAEYGATVKALFGKDGKIADIIVFAQNDTITGLLIDTSFKTWEDGDKESFNGYYSTLLTTDGATHEYFTDKDYKNFKGRVVTLKFANEKAVISPQNSSGSIGGVFDWNNKTLGGNRLSDYVNIIDIAFNDEYTKAKGKKVFAQRLDGVKIDPGDIEYIKKSDSGITDIILNNYTNDLYSYGMVLKAENKSGAFAAQGVYELNVAGEYIKFTTANKLFSVYTGMPVRVDFDNGVPFGLAKLNAVNDKIIKVDDLYAYTDTDKYLLADNSLIYKKVYNMSNDGESFEIIPKSKIDYSQSIKAYYDKPQNNGGRIRIIVISD